MKSRVFNLLPLFALLVSLVGSFTSVTPVHAQDAEPPFPSVLSIARVNSNPTKAPSVNFTVSFNTSVTGVDTTDFILATTGVTGASITGVSGLGTTYTVTVNRGSGVGTIRLDVIDDDSILNGSSAPLGNTGNGNGDFTSGQIYTIADLTVTTSADDTTTDTFCSLREAITNANNDAQTYPDCVAGIGTDTITFLSNYTITLVSSQLPVVTTPIIITGNGAANTIVEANAVANTATYRVIEVGAAGNLTLDSLTVRHGRCNGSCAGVSTNSGGGICNSGTLTVTNSTISGNSATTAGGGIYNIGTLTVTNSTLSGNSTSAIGGGIYNESGLTTLTNSTLSGNTAPAGGGFNNNAGATLTLTNSTLSGNSATTTGGGIYNIGTLNYANTIIANSTAGGDCVNTGSISTNTNNLVENNSCSPALSGDPALGPLANNGGPTFTHALLTSSPALNAGTNTGCPSTDQRGVARPQFILCDIGAVESNTQQDFTLVVNTNEDSNDGFCDAFVAGVTDCTLREAINYANGTGGTWTITFAADYTITLGSQLPAVTGTIIINGNGAANTIIQANAAPNTVTYRNFQVGNSGNLTLDNLTVRNGRCNASCATLNDGAGGILNDGMLTVTNSTISGNNSNADGGGIYNRNATLIVTNSTLSGNSAFSGGGILNTGTLTFSNSTLSGNSAGYGGGIYQYSLLTTVITNGTLSGNSASVNGGGIYNESGNPTITNSTFSGNSASNGGGMYNKNASSPTLKNVIIANSTGGDCVLIDSASINAASSSNLIESTGTNACGLTATSQGGNNVIGSDPALGGLTGSPSYFPLLFSSTAINTGNAAVCAAAPVNNTSQNGVTRPQGPRCDIGSFEFVTGGDTTGVFRPSNGVLFMKNTNTSGFADIAINYGIPADYPVTGDWDGNGTATIGVYRNGQFLLRNSNTLGFADMAFAFGAVGDQPIAGDWDGDGTDTIGIYRPTTGQFLLRNTNSAGASDASFFLGNAGDLGIAGDWNGDGLDTTGVFRPSNGVLFMKNANTSGFADIAINYGIPGDQPVTGDWDADGVDTIGVYRNGQFLLRNSNTLGFADIVFALGIPGDMPIAGNWDGIP